MKRILLFILIIGTASLWSLDEVYHTNEEIIAELDSLYQIHSDIMMIREFGLTKTDSLPVYGVKISDNVLEDEDEPAVLFLGQCHAEEVIGVELSMQQIHDILTYRNLQPYSIWIQYMEIWIIPTHNPEGLQVVTDEWDTAFRKNRTDNNNNGIFDFIPGPGYDIDGVDLNRNYDFNWVHSDTLYAPGGEEPYDYYRGPHPWSEPEAQFIRSLCEEQHFIYSIAWHSSRSGNLDQQVIYPWNWAGNKPCPDLDFISDLAEATAHLIELENGSGFYEPSATLGRNSKAHDWFYNEYGTVQFEIEAGSENLQPGPDLLQDTINRCMNAPDFLMNRAIGYYTDAAMLTGHVYDAVSGEPIVAEFFIEERDALSFRPRMTDELYGRFWWPCLPGSYTLHVRQKGYEDYVDDKTVNNSLWTEVQVDLQPLEEATLSGTFNELESDLEIIVQHEMGDEIYTFAAGETNYEIGWWEGNISLIITAAGYVPQYLDINLSAGANEADFNLQPEIVVFSEDWSNDFSQWEVTGDWYIGYDEETEKSFAKDTQDIFYDNSSEALLTTYNLQNLNNGSNLSLIIEQKYHTEHEEDFCEVQISTNDGASWQTLQSVSGISEWNKSYYDLTGYENTLAWLRFRLITDDTIDDPGWWLGEIKLVSATAVDTSPAEIVPRTRLQASYPNPFVPGAARSAGTQINYSLADSGEIELSVYNLKGQKVIKLADEYQESGDYSLMWDGRSARGEILASGVYFYMLTTQNSVHRQKMLLLK